MVEIEIGTEIEIGIEIGIETGEGEVVIVIVTGMMIVVVVVVVEIEGMVVVIGNQLVMNLTKKRNKRKADNQIKSNQIKKRL